MEVAKYHNDLQASTPLPRNLLIGRGPVSLQTPLHLCFQNRHFSHRVHLEKFKTLI